MSTESLAVCLYSAEVWTGDITAGVVDENQVRGGSGRICNSIRRASFEEKVERNESVHEDGAEFNDHQNHGGFLWRNITGLCSFLWRAFLTQASLLSQSVFGRRDRYIAVHQGNTSR